MDLFKWWWLLSLVVICAMGCAVIFIITIVNLFGFDVCLTSINFSQVPTKSVKWLSTLSLLSFVICCFFQLPVILALDNKGQVPSSIFQQSTQFIGLMAWTFGQLFIYLLFIANLQFSFKHTMLRLSKRSLIFLITSIIAFCICRIAYITLYTLFYNGILSTQQAEYSLLISVCGTEFVDLILSIILIYLFIHRLFKLVSLLPNKYDTNYHHQYTQDFDSYLLPSTTTEDTKSVSVNLLVNAKKQTDMNHMINNVNEENIMYSPSISSDDSDTGTIFEHKQAAILYVASKYAILSSIAIISTQVFLISAAIDALSFSDDQSDNDAGFYIVSFSVYFGFLSLDCFINALCICLNFAFNRIWFWSICCLCHDCCYSICFFLSNKR